jgi:nitrilase
MDSLNTQYRAAVVQAEPVWLDADATIEKAIGLIGQAADAGVDLVAFPETWVPGYPWWIWLGAPAWGMQFVQRYFENSLVVGEERLRRVQDAAAAHGIHVSLGFSERAGGSLYMAQALIDASGAIVSARRKLKPTHVERSVFGEGAGCDLAVVDLPIGKVGSLCCWEHLQPLTRYAMYSKGEQVHVAAWPAFSLYSGLAYALGPEVNLAASRMYAVEGQCYVLAACAVIGQAGQSMFCDTPDKVELLPTGGGHARIFAPDGRELGEALDEHAEGLVIADIDLGAIALAKAAADPVGHYARPDVTRLYLNSSALPRVEEMPAVGRVTREEAVELEPEPEEVV